VKRFIIVGLVSFATACATTKVKAPEATSSTVATAAPASPTSSSKPGNPDRTANNPPGDNRDAFERAIQAALKRDVLSAEQQLRAALQADPTVDHGWTDLGVLYEREALPDRAEQSYRKALELKPDQEAAWIYLARLNCRSKRVKPIEAELRTAVEKRPDSVGARNALVFVLLYQDKQEEAANEAKKVLKLDERNVRAMQLLSQVYYRQGKFELCKMVLENAHAIQPKDAATLNALGVVSLQLKAKAPALEYFRQASEAQPDFAEAKNNYGALLNESQDYESAARVLEDAVSAAPDFAGARLNLGNAYRGKQDFGKAIAQYKQALNLTPDTKDAYFNLAILHLDSEIPNVDAIDRLKTAISYFQQFREKGGQDDRIDQYINDANKDIEKEVRRREREKKNQLKNARKEPTQAPESKGDGSADAKVSGDVPPPQPQKSPGRAGKKSHSPKLATQEK
jgi:Tfp pilus assembly protein PilF